MTDGMIIPAKSIDQYMLGIKRNELLSKLNEYNLKPLSMHDVIITNNLKFWIDNQMDIVTQIMIFGNSKSKFLNKIGIGSTLSELSNLGIEWSKGSYVYFLPKYPGISFELLDENEDEEEWEPLRAPFEYISVFLPDYVEIG